MSHFALSHGAVCSEDAAHRVAFAEFCSFAIAECQTMVLASEMVAASVLRSAGVIPLRSDPMRSH